MADAIVHSVPGPWASRNGFISALASATADQPVLAAGPTMHAVESDTHSEWSWAPPDPTLAKRFALTLRRFPDVEENLEALNDHASVVYVIQKEPGQTNARTAWSHATACLKAGGVGVMADVSGLAHTPSTWAAGQREPDLHALTVLHMISGHGGFYSSGMTQFGLPDTFVETSGFDEAVETARSFERYQLLESPSLSDGHSFSITADAPVWIISHMPHPSGNECDIDRSPGMWVLRKGGRG